VNENISHGISWLNKSNRFNLILFQNV